MGSNVGNVRGLSFAFGYHWDSEQMAERQVTLYDDDHCTPAIPTMKTALPQTNHYPDPAFGMNLVKIISYIPVISLLYVYTICSLKNHEIFAFEHFTWYAKALLYARVAVCAIGAGAIFLPIDLIATVIKGVRHHCWAKTQIANEID